jgi:3-dehydroquinate synthetase
MEAMLLDKKTVGGRLRFVLARSIGSVEVREVAAEDVAAVLGGEGGCCAS